MIRTRRAALAQSAKRFSEKIMRKTTTWSAMASHRALGDFEHPLDLDRSVRRQRGDADGGAGMAALVAKGLHHQVGGAVQDFWPIEKIRRGIDEAAQADDAHHLVEIAERGLDLRQQVDGAAACGRGALFDGNAGA